MKKGLLSIITLTAIFILVASTGAFAQLTWEIGAKGGLSFSDFIGDDADSTGVTDMRMGFVGGAFVTAHINDDFAVRVEGLYVQKGTTCDELGIDEKIKLDYFEVPILAVIKLPASEKFEVNGFAGPTIAFNITSEYTAEGDFMGTPIDITEDLEDVKSTDFGLTVGAGFAYDLGSAKIVFDGRWVYGLTSIDDSTEDFNIKNSSFALRAGIAIPIGK
jgi:hypothetical protein